LEVSDFRDVTPRRVTEVLQIFRGTWATANAHTRLHVVTAIDTVTFIYTAENTSYLTNSQLYDHTM